MRVLQLQAAKGWMEISHSLSHLLLVQPLPVYVVVMLSHPLRMLYFQFPSCSPSPLGNPSYRQKRGVPVPSPLPECWDLV